MTGFLKSWQHNSSKGSTDTHTNPVSDTTKTKANFDATKQASMTFFICLVKPVITPATNVTSSHDIFDENLKSDQNLTSQNRLNGAVAADDLKHYSSKHSVDAKYLSVDQM